MGYGFKHSLYPQLHFPVNDYKVTDGFLSGVAYTSECFHCKPGTHSAKQGSARCAPCPADTFSNKGATVCHQCDRDKYAGMHVYISNAHKDQSYNWRDLTAIPDLHVTTHMQSHLHANTAFTAYTRGQRLREVSVDLNVNCVFSHGLGFFFYQRLVQRAANRDLRVQTVTSSTPTLHVTLRER